jgi:hypothetical protein
MLCFISEGVCRCFSYKDMLRIQNESEECQEFQTSEVHTFSFGERLGMENTLCRLGIWKKRILLTNYSVLRVQGSTLMILVQGYVKDKNRISEEHFQEFQNSKVTFRFFL